MSSQPPQVTGTSGQGSSTTGPTMVDPATMPNARRAAASSGSTTTGAASPTAAATSATASGADSRLEGAPPKPETPAISLEEWGKQRAKAYDDAGLDEGLVKETKEERSGVVVTPKGATVDAIDRVRQMQLDAERMPRVAANHKELVAEYREQQAKVLDEVAREDAAKVAALKLQAEQKRTSGDAAGADSLVARATALEQTLAANREELRRTQEASAEGFENQQEWMKRRAAALTLQQIEQGNFNPQFTVTEDGRLSHLSSPTGTSALTRATLVGQPTGQSHGWAAPQVNDSIVYETGGVKLGNSRFGGKSTTITYGTTKVQGKDQPSIDIDIGTHMGELPSLEARLLACKTAIAMAKARGMRSINLGSLAKMFPVSELGGSFGGLRAYAKAGHLPNLYAIHELARFAAQYFEAEEIQYEGKPYAKWREENTAKSDVKDVYGDPSDVETELKSVATDTYDRHMAGGDEYIIRECTQPNPTLVASYRAAASPELQEEAFKALGPAEMAELLINLDPAGRTKFLAPLSSLKRASVIAALLNPVVFPDRDRVSSLVMEFYNTLLVRGNDNLAEAQRKLVKVLPQTGRMELVRALAQDQHVESCAEQVPDVIRYKELKDKSKRSAAEQAELTTIQALFGPRHYCSIQTDGSLVANDKAKSFYLIQKVFCHGDISNKDRAQLLEMVTDKTALNLLRGYEQDKAKVIQIVAEMSPVKKAAVLALRSADWLNELLVEKVKDKALEAHFKREAARSDVSTREQAEALKRAYPARLYGQFNESDVIAAIRLPTPPPGGSIDLDQLRRVALLAAHLVPYEVDKKGRRDYTKREAFLEKCGVPVLRMPFAISCGKYVDDFYSTSAQNDVRMTLLRDLADSSQLAIAIDLFKGLSTQQRAGILVRASIHQYQGVDAFPKVLPCLLALKFEELIQLLNMPVTTQARTRDTRISFASSGQLANEDRLNFFFAIINSESDPAKKIILMREILLKLNIDNQTVILADGRMTPDMIRDILAGVKDRAQYQVLRSALPQPQQAVVEDRPLMREEVAALQQPRVSAPGNEQITSDVLVKFTAAEQQRLSAQRALRTAEQNPQPALAELMRLRMREKELLRSREQQAEANFDAALSTAAPAAAPSVAAAASAAVAAAQAPAAPGYAARIAVVLDGMEEKEADRVRDQALMLDAVNQRMVEAFRLPAMPPRLSFEAALAGPADQAPPPENVSLEAEATLAVVAAFAAADRHKPGEQRHILADDRDVLSLYVTRCKELRGSTIDDKAAARLVAIFLENYDQVLTMHRGHFLLNVVRKTLSDYADAEPVGRAAALFAALEVAYRGYNAPDHEDEEVTITELLSKPPAPAQAAAAASAAPADPHSEQNRQAAALAEAAAKDAVGLVRAVSVDKFKAIMPRARAASAAVDAEEQKASGPPAASATTAAAAAVDATGPAHADVSQEADREKVACLMVQAMSGDEPDPSCDSPAKLFAKAALKPDAAPPLFDQQGRRTAARVTSAALDKLEELKREPRLKGESVANEADIESIRRELDAWLSRNYDGLRTKPLDAAPARAAAAGDDTEDEDSDDFQDIVLQSTYNTTDLSRIGVCQEIQKVLKEKLASLPPAPSVGEAAAAAAPAASTTTAATVTLLDDAVAAPAAAAQAVDQHAALRAELEANIEKLAKLQKYMEQEPAIKAQQQRESLEQELSRPEVLRDLYSEMVASVEDARRQVNEDGQRHLGRMRTLEGAFADSPQRAAQVVVEARLRTTRDLQDVVAPRMVQLQAQMRPSSSQEKQIVDRLKRVEVRLAEIKKSATALSDALVAYAETPSTGATQVAAAATRAVAWVPSIFGTLTRAVTAAATGAMVSATTHKVESYERVQDEPDTRIKLVVPSGDAGSEVYKRAQIRLGADAILVAQFTERLVDIIKRMATGNPQEAEEAIKKFEKLGKWIVAFKAQLKTVDGSPIVLRDGQNVVEQLERAYNHALAETKKQPNPIAQFGHVLDWALGLTAEILARSQSEQLIENALQNKYPPPGTKDKSSNKTIEQLGGELAAQSIEFSRDAFVAGKTVGALVVQLTSPDPSARQRRKEFAEFLMAVGDLDKVVPILSQGGSSEESAQLRVLLFNEMKLGDNVSPLVAQIFRSLSPEDQDAIYEHRLLSDQIKQSLWGMVSEQVQNTDFTSALRVCSARTTAESPELKKLMDYLTHPTLSDQRRAVLFDQVVNAQDKGGLVKLVFEKLSPVQQERLFSHLKPEVQMEYLLNAKPNDALRMFKSLTDDQRAGMSKTLITQVTSLPQSQQQQAQTMQQRLGYLATNLSDEQLTNLLKRPAENTRIEPVMAVQLMAVGTGTGAEGKPRPTAKAIYEAVIASGNRGDIAQFMSKENIARLPAQHQPQFNNLRQLFGLEQPPQQQAQQTSGASGPGDADPAASARRLVPPV